MSLGCAIIGGILFGPAGFVAGALVNNQKENLHHNLCKLYHIMSKDLRAIYDSLRPIYEELDEDFQAIDVVDLIYYERWLNE